MATIVDKQFFLQLGAEIRDILQANSEEGNLIFKNSKARSYTPKYASNKSSGKASGSKAQASSETGFVDLRLTDAMRLGLSFEAKENEVNIGWKQNDLSKRALGNWERKNGRALFTADKVPKNVMKLIEQLTGDEIEKNGKKFFPRKTIININL